MRFSLFLGVFFLKTLNINLSWITTKIYIILLEFSLIPKIWTNPPRFKKNPRLKKKNNYWYSFYNERTSLCSILFQCYWTAKQSNYTGWRRMENNVLKAHQVVYLFLIRVLYISSEVYKTQYQSNYIANSWSSSMYKNPCDYWQILTVIMMFATKHWIIAQENLGQK